MRGNRSIVTIPEFSARVIPRIVFYGAVGLATAILGAVEVIILIRSGLPRSHPDLCRGLINGMILMTFGACHEAADAFLKRLGLSRSGKAIEQRTRTPLAPDADDGDDQVIEVRPSRDLIIMLWFFVAVTVIFLIVLLALLAGPSRELRAIAALLGMTALTGATARMFWAARRWPIRADAHGITASRHVMVPWEDIARCEIQTTYDPFGTPKEILPILKGKRGEVLLELHLNNWNDRADCDRFLRFIRSRLPKLAVDEIDDAL